MSDTTGAVTARENGRPPRDELVRALRVGGDVRAADEGGMPTLYGHFTVFNRWAEIDSFFEGHFLERIAPGAFKKTFREQTPKVLFQHGMDPQIGDKVLGRADVLREEAEGPYYEVPLLDTSYNRDLVPGLEADLYGASFRFSVMREEWDDEPDPSDDNPKGIPERTIKEARVSEFGPVTFPAYPDATAGVRSLTDEFIIARATRDPERLRAMLSYLDDREASRDAGDDDVTVRLPVSRAVFEENDPGDVREMLGQAAFDAAQELLGEKPEGKTEADRSAEEQETETVVPGAKPTPPSGSEAVPGGQPTPLYFGKRKTAPGAKPTPIYTGNRKKKRKGWVA